MPPRSPERHLDRLIALLGTGHQLNLVIIQRLQALAERQIIRETILVAMPEQAPATENGSVVAADG